MHIPTDVLMLIDFLFQFQGAIITIVKPSKLHTQPKCVWNAPGVLVDHDFVLPLDNNKVEPS